jgi:F0F1-type ATP synthase membrane subunit b/b'
MKVLVLLALSGSVYASGDGHGSPADLIPAFFNVFLLGGFLVWKLKGVFKKHFETKSESISEIMESASVKAKEAEMMMQMQKKKIDGMVEEISKINSDVAVDIERFKNDYSKDVQDRIIKLQNDAAQKIESEKKELANELNETLVDSVILKAKEILKKDKSLNEQATSKILEGLK